MKRGDAPMVGITKLEDGVTLEDLKRPRRQIAPVKLLQEAAPNPEAKAAENTSAVSPQL